MTRIPSKTVVDRPGLFVTGEIYSTFQRSNTVKGEKEKGKCRGSDNI